MQVTIKYSDGTQEPVKGSRESLCSQLYTPLRNLRRTDVHCVVFGGQEFTPTDFFSKYMAPCFDNAHTHR